MRSPAQAIRGGLGRRAFLGLAPGAALAPVVLAAPATDAAPPGPTLPHFPRQDPALVREVVGASHGDIDRVRRLVERSPALAKASIDWGFGDWESALGAASHTGRRDIAELLIGHGARPNLFTFAMLGDLAVVRAAIGADPTLATALGPHSIPLVRHARAGGERAAGVVAFLESLPGVDGERPSQRLAGGLLGELAGEYLFGPHASDRLVVAAKRGRLTIARDDGPGRGLEHIEGLAFRPAGAERVRIVFSRVGERVATVAVHDPEPIVVATRAE